MGHLLLFVLPHELGISEECFTTYTMAHIERELKQRVEFLPDRLYYVTLSALPSSSSRGDKHFFSIDQELIYWNFYLDFGPLNLGHLHKFFLILNSRLADPSLKDKVIYFYSGTHPHQKTNAAFLICAWAMAFFNMSPEESFKPFRDTSASFTPWVSAIFHSKSPDEHSVFFV